MTVVMLAVFGGLALLVSGVLAMQARSVAPLYVQASGVVSALNEGPLHVEIEVAGADGRRFTYTDNSSRTPLRVGQAVPVRYLAADPARTAQIANHSIYATARDFALLGLALILAAGLSPLLVARFPGVFGFALRR